MYLHYKEQFVKAVYADAVAVSFKNHTKQINVLRGQNVDFVNRKPSGTYSDQ